MSVQPMSVQPDEWRGRVAEVGDALGVWDGARLLWLRHVLGPWRRRRWHRPELPPPLTAQQIMQRVAELRVATWSYEFEPGVRHLGPMAQDFAAAFGLGRTNRMIEEVDAIGVMLVAVQVLNRRLEELENEAASSSPTQT